MGEISMGVVSTGGVSITRSAIQWDLHYRSGTICNPITDDHSIRSAPPNAIRMFIRNGDIPLFTVALVEDQVTYKPIFYRVKSVNTGSTKISTDIIVFGRARSDITGQIQSDLYALTKDGTVITCPVEFVDATMITLQTT
jgi:hypothetical protein